MDQVARVVLAIEQHDVVEEVMHFLDGAATRGSSEWPGRPAAARRDPPART